MKTVKNHERMELSWANNVYNTESSSNVWCHQVAKTPDDVMLGGVVGQPRFEVEQWRPRWRKAVETMGLNGPK